MQETLSQLPPLLLVATYLVFWCWEALHAARQRFTGRFRRSRNLAISLVCIAVSATTGAGVLWLSAVAATRQWGLQPLTGLPGWAAILAGVRRFDQPGDQTIVGMLATPWR